MAQMARLLQVAVFIFGHNSKTQQAVTSPTAIMLYGQEALGLLAPAQISVAKRQLGRSLVDKAFL